MLLARRLACAGALLVALGAGDASPAPQPRPLTGCALLSAPEGTEGEVVVYAEPGVQRLASLPLERLPRLSRGGASTTLAALNRRGRWVKIAYDDAERQGWIEASPRWEYLPWRSALPGREVRPLPAQKKTHYLLRDHPGEEGGECGELPRNRTVRILSVQDDWALSEAPAGWFRWRDPEGRLTIALEP